MLLAVFREDLRYPFARTLDDGTVEVHELTAQGTGQESARSLKALVGSPVARSTVRRALAIVEMGFIAAAITTGSPFVIPPSNPPRRLLLRARRPFSESISSWTSLERREASSKPIPNSTPLIALMDIMAAASLASSLSRQST